MRTLPSNWLVRMLEGGEDPLYIARRMVRAASEDIGNADPQALIFGIACSRPCIFSGCRSRSGAAQLGRTWPPRPNRMPPMPATEKRSPRCGKATIHPLPLHIRNAPTRLMKTSATATGTSTHRLPRPDRSDGGLPEALRGRRFYEPEDVGFEAEMRARLEKMKDARKGVALSCQVSGKARSS